MDKYRRWSGRKCLATGRTLPVPDLNTLQPFVMPMSGLLPSPIQPRKFSFGDDEELMEAPRPGMGLREVANIAVLPALGGWQ
ncbi:hypothetical protein AB6A40_000153 [Gnathostoma spinigerum]|uniref:Uncharacterized protein n=1 Tax=Gnathostoma spinigerum TaxID=75299 RepID=A0ABD6E7U0_9BILA